MNNYLRFRLLNALSVDVKLGYWNVKDYWRWFSQACMLMRRWLKNVNSLLVTQWTLLEKENIRAKVQFVWGLKFSTDSFDRSLFVILFSSIPSLFYLFILIHPSIHQSIGPSVHLSFLKFCSFVCSFLRAFVCSFIHLSPKTWRYYYSPE